MRVSSRFLKWKTQVSVIIPTVDGREEVLEKCLASYERTLKKISWEVLLYRNRETCGIAWNEGVEQAKGSLIHLTADDIEAHEGWFSAGLESLGRKELPAARILNTDGSLQSCGDEEYRPDGFVTEVPRIPFLTTDLARQIFPINPIHYYCVPIDHRILTRRGFLRYDETMIGEPVMVFDHRTHEIRWEPLLAVNVFPFRGELSVIERKGDRFEFTQNHSWPTVSQSGKRELGPLRTGRGIPVRGWFDGSDSILSPRHAAILGWVVGDGHIRKDGSMWVAQSPKKHLGEVMDLLGRETPGGKNANGVHMVYVRPDDRAVIASVYSGKKSLPEIASRLSRSAAKAMLDALVKAEGSRTAAGGTVISQSAKNWPVREAVQILALLTGSNTSIGVNDGKRVKDMFLKSSAALHVQEITGVPHEGHIWCPTTPSGTWFVEHDGACLPTGNTDNLIGDAARSLGWKTVVNREYCFTHHLSSPGRIDSRLMADYHTYMNGRGQ